MKRGSNILLIMMAGYLLIAAIVAVVYFLPKASDGDKMPEALQERQEARVRGDASSDTQIPDNWSAGGIEWKDPTPTPTPVPEPEPVVEEKQYYTFRVINMRSYLYVRQEPDKSSAKVGEMKPGTTGYVIDRGEEWSEIVTENGKTRGYSFNKYMEFTEVGMEEIPEEYR